MGVDPNFAGHPPSPKTVILEAAGIIAQALWETAHGRYFLDQDVRLTLIELGRWIESLGAVDEEALVELHEDIDTLLREQGDD